jgi:hypothetical protein
MGRDDWEVYTWTAEEAGTEEDLSRGRKAF